MPQKLVIRYGEDERKEFDDLRDGLRYLAELLDGEAVTVTQGSLSTFVSSVKTGETIARLFVNDTTP